MSLQSLIDFVCFSLCVIAVTGSSQSGSNANNTHSSGKGHDWCYQGCEHTPSHWLELPNVQCGGDRQSPINIDTSALTADSSLMDFKFINFSNPHSMTRLINTGHSVKCELVENMVEIEGGGLNHTYSAIQFHFHSGDRLWHPGSEHLINEDRYPMEMHIVSLKKGLSSGQALKDKEGIAALGFFIDVTEEEETPEVWKRLTSYLVNITEKDSTIDIIDSISIDALLGEVNLTKFYRYKGSLTTPPCSEIVTWTVFQEPIKISKDMVELFPTTLKYVKGYRPRQNLNGRKVYASPAILQSSGHSWCYDDHCGYSPSHWHMLPDSKCGGERQSPINIDNKKAIYNQKLNSFTFTNFSYSGSVKYLTNTGHTVKCVLEENMLEIAGGGLNHSYSTIQFHFHWGKTGEHSSGSEHTVDSKRYPMEMHIVNIRKGLSVAEAKEDSEGLAVMGFFIEADSGCSITQWASLVCDEQLLTKSIPPYSILPPVMCRPVGLLATVGNDTFWIQYQTVTDEEENQKSWKTLTSYLSKIKNKDSTVNIKDHISIDDLLGGVDLSKYYRYMGSLTTPNCNEAVVWTVFKQPIKVNKNLVKLFPSSMGYDNVYRPEQKLHGRTVYTSTATTLPDPLPLLLLLSLLYVGYVWMGGQ